MAGSGKLPLDLVTTFVGRDEELARACRLLSHVRLLTLTGPGGVGKTRLALRVAHRLQTSAADAAWLIDLGTLRDPASCTPEGVYAHIAMAMGIRNHGTAGLDVLLNHVRNRRVLLVADNCEHLVPATRACVTALLRAAPHVRVLATSRQPLGVDGEHTLVVQPLPLVAAVDLFRAHATQAGASPGALADARVINDLCRRLDGLPLTIQLAAGRMRTLSARQLLDRLDDRFHLLTDTRAGTDRQDRHSTLERVVQWSHALCTGPEQLLWARASVFRRGFDLAAAEVVCAGDGIDRRDIVDLVAGLVDKSVLTVDHTTSPARYGLLDTLREYGLRKLDEVGQLRSTQERHGEYCRDLVARAASTWLGPGELDTMTTVYRDLPDVLAVVDEYVDRRDLATARAICRDVVRVRAPFFWGCLDLVFQTLSRVLEASGDDPVRTAEEAADRAGTMAAAAWVAVTQGRHETWRALVADAHRLLQQWRLEPTPPVLLAEGGGEALGFGNARAIGLLDGARTAFGAHDNTAGDQHMATMMWAMAWAFAGEPTDAVAASAEYLRRAEHAGAPWATTWALWTLALAMLRSGDCQRATEYVDRALRLQHDMDDQWGLMWSIELRAWIIATQLDRVSDPRREAERAAWLLGAAGARQHRLGVSLAGLRPLADRHAHARARLAAELGDLGLAETMAAGTRGHAKAIDVALGQPTSRRPTAAGDSGLTDREREVVALVTAGLTSVQIAAQLRISRRTVDEHVRNIGRKLNLRSRALIAVWGASQVTLGS
jgi:predicted ATPase/DNA-binding CsgD family transcriptional regulator